MLHQTFVKNTSTKIQKNRGLFSLIALTVLFVCQHVAYSQQYVIVDSENGDRLTGIWRGATDTHFDIEYQGQVLQLPLTGHTISFTSNRAHVPDRTAAKYFRNGLALLELGMPENAQHRFAAAIEEFPKYPDAHYQLGLLYKANGDTTKALERFRSVAILDAANFDLVPLFTEMGDAAIASEVYTEAVENYQCILTYYPEHASVPVLSYLTGFLLVEQLEDYTAGLSLLESAIKAYPDMSTHEKAFFLIGKLQAETGQLENALYTLEGFVMRYPESEWFYEARLIRAGVNLKLGRKAEAASEAQQVYESSVDETVRERAKQVLDQSRWTVYTDADGLPDNHIQAIAFDDTRLWVGTPKGVMLFQTRFDKWLPVEAVAQLINTHLENVPDVTAIAASSQEVWIGTRAQGVVHYNKLTGDIQTYPPTGDGFPAWIKDIKMDDSEIWFATETGVMRKTRGSVDAPLIYNTQNSFIPADDIECLVLTPQTVWGGSASGEIVMFNRGTEEWDSYRSTELREGMTVVGFDIAADQLLFTWFNADEKSNGYFRADLDGENGTSTTLDTGIEAENTLRNIYIRGALDTTPIVEEENEAPPAETPESPPSEFSPGTEGLEAPPLPAPQIPLVLWIATNDSFYTHHTRSTDVWDYTTTPQLITGELITRALVVSNNRAWIATTNGLATMKVQ